MYKVINEQDQVIATFDTYKEASDMIKNANKPLDWGVIW